MFAGQILTLSTKSKLSPERGEGFQASEENVLRRGEDPAGADLETLFFRTKKWRESFRSGEREGRREGRVRGQSSRYKREEEEEENSVEFFFLVLLSVDNGFSLA